MPPKHQRKRLAELTPLSSTVQIQVRTPAHLGARLVATVTAPLDSTLADMRTLLAAGPAAVGDKSATIVTAGAVASAADGVAPLGPATSVALGPHPFDLRGPLRFSLRGGASVVRVGAERKLRVCDVLPHYPLRLMELHGPFRFRPAPAVAVLPRHWAEKPSDSMSFAQYAEAARKQQEAQRYVKGKQHDEELDFSGGFGKKWRVKASVRPWLYTRSVVKAPDATEEAPPLAELPCVIFVTVGEREDGTSAPDRALADRVALQPGAGTRPLAPKQLAAALTKANANVPDLFGRTVLHDAAAAGHFAVVSFLAGLSFVALDAADANRDTPLHLAVRHGHLEVVAALVDAGASVTAVNQRGQTPLHTALYGRHDSIVDVLCRRLKASGVPPDSLAEMVDSAGFAPTELFLALLPADFAQLCHDGELGMLQCLHRHYLLGARNIASSAPTAAGANGQSPLHVAAAAGHTQVVSWLLDEIRVPATGKSTLDVQKRSPLHLACLAGHTDVVRCLVQHQADPDALDVVGASPLLLALRRRHWHCAELLLRHVRPLATAATADRAGATPLHLCAAAGQTQLMALLLQEHQVPAAPAADLSRDVRLPAPKENRPDPAADRPDPRTAPVQYRRFVLRLRAKYRRPPSSKAKPPAPRDLTSKHCAVRDTTPLWAAVRASQRQRDSALVAEAVDLLLRYGAAEQEGLKSLLASARVALTHRYYDVAVALLKAAGAAVVTMDTSLLSGFAAEGDTHGVRWLLERGVGSQCHKRTDPDDAPPLCVACRTGSVPMVGLFLSLCATSASGDVGPASLMAAVEGGHHGVVGLLVQNGVRPPPHAVAVAASRGAVQLVEALLGFGASPNACLPDTGLPAVWACIAAASATATATFALRGRDAAAVSRAESTDTRRAALEECALALLRHGASVSTAHAHVAELLAAAGSKGMWRVVLLVAEQLAALPATARQQAVQSAPTPGQRVAHEVVPLERRGKKGKRRGGKKPKPVLLVRYTPDPSAPEYRRDLRDVFTYAAAAGRADVVSQLVSVVGLLPWHGGRYGDIRGYTAGDWAFEFRSDEAAIALCAAGALPRCGHAVGPAPGLRVLLAAARAAWTRLQRDPTGNTDLVSDAPYAEAEVRALAASELVLDQLLAAAADGLALRLVDAVAARLPPAELAQWITATGGPLDSAVGHDRSSVVRQLLVRVPPLASEDAARALMAAAANRSTAMVTALVEATPLPPLVATAAIPTRAAKAISKHLNSSADGAGATFSRSTPASALFVAAAFGDGQLASSLLSTRPAASSPPRSPSAAAPSGPNTDVIAVAVASCGPGADSIAQRAADALVHTLLDGGVLPGDVPLAVALATRRRLPCALRLLEMGGAAAADAVVKGSADGTCLALSHAARQGNLAFVAQCVGAVSSPAVLKEAAQEAFERSVASADVAETQPLDDPEALFPLPDDAAPGDASPRGAVSALDAALRSNQADVAALLLACGFCPSPRLVLPCRGLDVHMVREAAASIRERALQRHPRCSKATAGTMLSASGRRARQIRTRVSAAASVGAPDVCRQLLTYAHEAMTVTRHHQRPPPAPGTEGGGNDRHGSDDDTYGSHRRDREEGPFAVAAKAPRFCRRDLFSCGSTTTALHVACAAGNAAVPNLFVDVAEKAAALGHPGVHARVVSFLTAAADDGETAPALALAVGVPAAASAVLRAVRAAAPAPTPAMLASGGAPEDYAPRPLSTSAVALPMAMLQTLCGPARTRAGARGTSVVDECFKEGAAPETLRRAAPLAGILPDHGSSLARRVNASYRSLVQRSGLGGGFGPNRQYVFTAVTPVTACAFAGDTAALRQVLASGCDPRCAKSVMVRHGRGEESAVTPLVVAAERLLHTAFALATAAAPGSTGDETFLAHRGERATVADRAAVVRLLLQEGAITEDLVSPLLIVFARLSMWGLLAATLAAAAESPAMQPFAPRFVRALDAPHPLLAAAMGAFRHPLHALCAADAPQETLVATIRHCRRSDVESAVDTAGRTAMWYAITRGAKQALEVLLGVQVPCDAWCDRVAERTPLMVAAAAGQFPAVSRLIGGYLGLDATDRRGWTALMHACAHGHQSIVELLVATQTPLDLSPTDTRTGNNAIMLALLGGHERVAVPLVQHWARLDQLETTRTTAMHCAARGGCPEALRLLCQREDIDVAATAAQRGDADGHTPLYLAYAHGHAACLRPLVAAVHAAPSPLADLSPIVRGIVDGRTVLRRPGWLRDVMRLNGDIHGRVEAAKKAASASASTFTRDRAEALLPSSLGALALLTGQERDVGPLMSSSVRRLGPNGTREGNKLLWCAQTGNVVGLRVLADHNTLDDCGALHAAAARDHTDICQLLLTLGVSELLTLDRSGYTALHCALRGGAVGTAEYLLSQWPLPHGLPQLLAEDERGQNVFHLAAQVANGRAAPLLSALLNRLVEANTALEQQRELPPEDVDDDPFAFGQQHTASGPWPPSGTTDRPLSDSTFDPTSRAALQARDHAGLAPLEYALMFGCAGAVLRLAIAIHTAGSSSASGQMAIPVAEAALREMPLMSPEVRTLLFDVFGVAESTERIGFEADGDDPSDLRLSFADVRCLGLGRLASDAFVARRVREVLTIQHERAFAFRELVQSLRLPFRLNFRFDSMATASQPKQLFVVQRLATTSLLGRYNHVVRSLPAGAVASVELEYVPRTADVGITVTDGVIHERFTVHGDVVVTADLAASLEETFRIEAGNTRRALETAAADASAALRVAFGTHPTLKHCRVGVDADEYMLAALSVADRHALASGTVQALQMAVTMAQRAADEHLGGLTAAQLRVVASSASTSIPPTLVVALVPPLARRPGATRAMHVDPATADADVVLLQGAVSACSRDGTTRLRVTTRGVTHSVVGTALEHSMFHGLRHDANLVKVHLLRDHFLAAVLPPAMHGVDVIDAAAAAAEAGAAEPEMPPSLRFKLEVEGATVGDMPVRRLGETLANIASAFAQLTQSASGAASVSAVRIVARNVRREVAALGLLFSTRRPPSAQRVGQKLLVSFTPASVPTSDDVLTALKAATVQAELQRHRDQLTAVVADAAQRLHTYVPAATLNVDVAAILAADTEPEHQLAALAMLCHKRGALVLQRLVQCVAVGWDSRLGATVRRHVKTVHVTTSGGRPSQLELRARGHLVYHAALLSHTRIPGTSPASLRSLAGALLPAQELCSTFLMQLLPLAHQDAIAAAPPTARPADIVASVASLVDHKAPFACWSQLVRSGAPALPGRKARVLLITRNVLNRACTVGGADVSMVVSTGRGGERQGDDVPVAVKDLGDGRYLGTFTVPGRMRHPLYAHAVLSGVSVGRGPLRLLPRPGDLDLRRTALVSAFDTLVVGWPATVELQTKDSEGNHRSRSAGLTTAVQAPVPSAGVNVTGFCDLGNGRIRVTVEAPAALPAASLALRVVDTSSGDVQSLSAPVTVLSEEQLRDWMCWKARRPAEEPIRRRRDRIATYFRDASRKAEADRWKREATALGPLAKRRTLPTEYRAKLAALAHRTANATR